MLTKPISLFEAGAPGGPWGAAQAPAGRAAGGRGAAYAGAVVALLSRLERLLASDMTAQQRIALLMLLDPQILPLTADLAKPVAPSRQTDGSCGAGPTLEQRLDRLAAKNLSRGIEALDQSPHAYSEEAANQRWWLVKHLFRALARAIEYCFRWNRSWPPEVWRQCHDLYFYLVSRPDLPLGSNYDRGAPRLDPLTEYKRLLLLGLAHERVAAEARALILAGPLREWSEQSRLRDPSGFDGAFGIYVVEIARDLPPWAYPAALDPGFRGWVLEPAPSFLERLCLRGDGEYPTPVSPLDRTIGSVRPRGVRCDDGISPAERRARG
ncbi:MAG: hypothetical protein MUC77_14295 [Chromatiaceae bacterium]|jgi:hypothetical protein|nr:hypothetical protein [Chromatiaceae bacterium]